MNIVLTKETSALRMAVLVLTAVTGIGLGSSNAIAQAAPEIKPPPTVAVKTRPNSVTLRSGSHSETMKSLTVKRQFQTSQLRANPVITLGRTKVNMASVFNNPSALPNVAMRLRAAPQLADVMTEDTQVLEVTQGLVLHHFLSYRLKPGVCSDPVRRSALRSTGVRCSNQLSDEARLAKFSTRGDPHYIADPRKRSIAIADAKKQGTAVHQQVAGDLAKLRASLNDPAQRAKIDSQRGSGEAARLSKLSDDQLKSEMINSSVTKIEQVMFVPTADKLDNTKTTLFVAHPPLKSIPIVGLGLLKGTSTPETSTDKPLEQQIFLTGFTLGRDYEWSQRVEKTISWCIFGCDSTYYVEAYAGFSYGFGLRFPIRMNGTYHFHRGSDGKETARVTTDFVPIDGSADDYAATGLDPTQIFNGKELVAQVEAHAGASFCLPGAVMAMAGLPGCANFDLKLGKDFTEGIPAPFTNGQFEPPAPGQTGLPGLEKTFDDFDLIGNQANFGIAGVQVFPAVRVDLHSTALKFTLHDNILKTDTALNSSGVTTDLGIDKTDHSSSFTIGTPVYNLGFTVTPGIDVHAFIDIEVWSDGWDWPIWFPQLAIELPPNGIDFSCHAGTTCTRSYQYSPTMSKSTNASMDPTINDRARSFDATWLEQCVDDTCKTGVKFVRLGAVLSAQQQNAANKNMQISDVDAIFKSAATEAKTLVKESHDRQSEGEIEAFRDLIRGVWTPKCSDLKCFKNVASIVDKEHADVVLLHNVSPDASIPKLYAAMAKEYGNKQLQAEVDASTARAKQLVNTPPIRH